MSAFKSIYQSLSKTGLWIPLLCWILLYPWKPFLLGFYYDDWLVIVNVVQTSAPFSLARLQELMIIFADRPGMGLLFFVSSSFLNDSWFAWHVFISLVVLGTALIIYRFIRSLFKLFDKDSNLSILSASVGCASYLFLPWLKGVENWPTIWCAYPLTGLFALVGMRFFEGWRKGEAPVLIPALIFFVQALMYEIFYFQYILFFAFGFISGVFKRLSYRTIALSFSVITGVQLLAIGINRSSSPRGFSDNWSSLFFTALKRLPSSLLKSAHEVKACLIILLVGICVLAIYRIFKLYQAKKLQSVVEAGCFIKLVVGCLIVCFGGIAMSIGILSLGGRHINAMGTFARSTISLTFWLNLLWVFGVYCVLSLSPRLSRFGVVGIALTIALFSYASVLRTLDFAKSWEWQRKIVDAAPMDKIRATDRHAVILFQGPLQVNWVYIFYESYPLSGAMSYFYPELRMLQLPKERVISGTTWKPFLVQANYETVWTGKEVIQRGVNHYPASELWLWDYNNGEFKKVTAPTTLDKVPLGFP